MDIYDIIVDELFKKKSLAALMFLIDGGRELEIAFNGCEYFISQSGSAKYVSIWQRNVAESEQSFESTYELICNAVINRKAFAEAWKSAELKFLL